MTGGLDTMDRDYRVRLDIGDGPATVLSECCGESMTEMRDTAGGYCSRCGLSESYKSMADRLRAAAQQHQLGMTVEQRDDLFSLLGPIGSEDIWSAARRVVRERNGAQSDLRDLRDRLDTALVEIDRINNERAKLTKLLEAEREMVRWLREKQALLGDVVRTVRGWAARWLVDHAYPHRHSLDAMIVMLEALDAHDAAEPEVAND